MEISFFKDKNSTPSGLQSNSNHHMTHKQGETFWLNSTDIYQLRWPLFSLLAWGKKRYIGHTKLLTPEKQRKMVPIVLSEDKWYFWHFKETAIDSTGKVSFRCCISWGQDGRKETESFSFTSFPTTRQALMANAAFVPPEYLPLHPILVSEYLKI